MSRTSSMATAYNEVKKKGRRKKEKKGGGCPPVTSKRLEKTTFLFSQETVMKKEIFDKFIIYRPLPQCS